MDVCNHQTMGEGLEIVMVLTKGTGLFPNNALSRVNAFSGVCENSWYRQPRLLQWASLVQRDLFFLKNSRQESDVTAAGHLKDGVSVSRTSINHANTGRAFRLKGCSQNRRLFQTKSHKRTVPVGLSRSTSVKSKTSKKIPRPPTEITAGSCSL
jgi:hypothetical protein